MNLSRAAVQFGKVRINTSINPEQRILTSTHRVSAFDCVLPFEVEDKGSILQAISVFFFTNTVDIIPNHFIGCLDAQTMLVKSGKVLPLEVIARGTLTGSLWRSYTQGGIEEVRKKWGLELPPGLKQHHRFSAPIITFTTKAAFGHDELVTPEEATTHLQNWLDQNASQANGQFGTSAKVLLQQVTNCAVSLFERGQQISAKAGLLLMDTKYEFALDDQLKLMLVDEIHTPDASRFVDLKAFEDGRIEHLSKEWLREEIQSVLKATSSEILEKEESTPFVLRSFWNETSFKSQLASGTRSRYMELFSRLFPQMKTWDVVAPHLLPWPVDPTVIRRAESEQRLPSRVLVVGNGGRDFTLSALLERQPDVDVVYSWPGRESWNGGKKQSLGHLSLEALLKFCRSESIGWAVFGPEIPIAQGVAEKLRAIGIPCLAPDLEGARLETSKIHTKNILNRAGCPTAEAWTIGWEELKAAALEGKSTPLSATLNQYPYVLKYESLAAGKGVCLVLNQTDLLEAIKHFEGNLPSWLAELAELAVTTFTKEQGEPQFLIEKLLPGKEISAIALCQGEDYVLLPFAQDFKRRNNQQTGPNTGGMGAVCPVSVPPSLEIQVHDIFKRTLKTLKAAGTNYRGFLFAGLMLDENNRAQVLEFNCRMGDPETQVIMPGLGRDLVLSMWLTSKNEPWTLNPWLNQKQPHSVQHDGLKRCFVVVAAPEYPERSAPQRTLAFPNTWLSHIEWIPSGVDANSTTQAGRIGGVLSTATSEQNAVQAAYEALKEVSFQNAAGVCLHYRTDIAFPVAEKE